jgi:predicted esterase
MEEIGMQVGGLSAFLLSPPQGQSGIAGGIVLLPAPTLSYSKVLIWLHGLGDDAAGWVNVMPTLSLEDTKFILPNAPKRPITAYGGIQMSAWSDIKGCTADAAEDRRGIEESATCIKKLIQAEIDRGVSPDRIAVGGFSQGGALALHICLRIGVSLAGCVSLSAWLPLRRDYPRALSVAASKSLKILQVRHREVVDHESNKTLAYVRMCKYI